jgi:hypothetical protein
LPGELLASPKPVIPSSVSIRTNVQFISDFSRSSLLPPRDAATAMPSTT